MHLPPQCVQSLNWPESSAVVDLDRTTLAGAPQYRHSKPITRKYEASLFAYYGREPYWKAPPIEMAHVG